MIAQTRRRLIPAAILFTAVSIVPFLCADAAEPYTIKNGIVDAHTFTGYLRYGETCYWCHGLYGSGGSFAPSLVDALKTLSHDEFTSIVVSGGVVNGQPLGYSTTNVFVMPAFGTNPNVMCFLDDIYAYLKGRSDAVIGRGRPGHEAIAQAEKNQEDACLGFPPASVQKSAEGD